MIPPRTATITCSAGLVLVKGRDPSTPLALVTGMVTELSPSALFVPNTNLMMTSFHHHFLLSECTYPHSLCVCLVTFISLRIAHAEGIFWYFILMLTRSKSADFLYNTCVMWRPWKVQYYWHRWICLVLCLSLSLYNGLSLLFSSMKAFFFLTSQDSGV